MKKFLKKLIAPFEIIKIILKSEPLYLLYALPSIVLAAALPVLYVYFPKLIIEHLTNGSEYSQILKTILIYAAILIGATIVNTFLSHKKSVALERFPNKLKAEIGRTIMGLTLKDIESASSRDIIQLSNSAASLTQTIDIFQKIISHIITAASLVYIIVRLDYLFVLLIGAVVLIKIIFENIRFRTIKKNRLLHAKNDRLGNYIVPIGYQSREAMEIRMNSLQNWIMAKTKIFRDTMVGLQFKGTKQDTVLGILTYIFTAVQSFVVLWLLSTRFTEGVISIADFTMYFTAVTTLSATLGSITEQITEYNRQVTNLSDYKKLNELKNFESVKVDSVSPVKLDLAKTEFKFENVCFSYPLSDKEILKNINITIKDKEKLVIVGHNGAGKSTFIKLLCKFYRPTSGRITLNGVDIWDIPSEQYNKIVGAVFQDFANFSFSLKENVSMSEEGDMQRIENIVSAMGLGEYAVSLPNGYDTFISKNFDSNGVELSGGQGQKIAISRAVYKDAPLLILDEPTASLDPRAESEIYGKFFDTAKDKTTVFISHRLAVSNIADNIAVFDDGQIKEYGSHKYLIEQSKLYAEMYNKQSESYIDKNN